MAKTKRLLVIILVMICTVISGLLLMGVTARLAVSLGWSSYPIYWVLQTAGSFVVLRLYNPARKGIFQRILNRLTKFDFERPAVAKLIGASKLVAISLVNFFLGPFIGAMLVKRLGYDRARAYVYAALFNAGCVIIWNSIYIFGGLGNLIKKLF